jgi:hypothetical protein
MMVVVSIIWYRLMQAVPEHGDAAVTCEQQPGNELMRKSPHGGNTPARSDSSRDLLTLAD